MSAIGVPIVLAPIFGPTIGGLLLEHVAWQSIFLVNLPIGIVTLVAALKHAAEGSSRKAPSGSTSSASAHALGVGLVGITYGLAETGSAGDASSPRSVLVPLVIGARSASPPSCSARCGSDTRC